MANRPNVLWISFEDTNPFYGCYGDPTGITPNLDRLAREGCVFTNAYSTAGVCAPARSAVITGMYPTAIGTHHMRTTHQTADAPSLPTPYAAVPPHYVRCFTEYLRDAGYYCTNNVKTDYQFDPPATAWDELSTEAHWRNRPDPSQPFFAVFNPTRTHESGMWEERTPEVEIDPGTVRVPPYFPDTPRVRAAIARMHGNIARSDRQLGELLAQLEEDGLAGNTIVMHWSDHGPMPRGKRWPYDSGIRVPLIVRWPAGAGNPGPGYAERTDVPAGGTATAATRAALEGAGAPRPTVNAAGGHAPAPGEPADPGNTPPFSVDGSHLLPPLAGFAPGTTSHRLVSTIDLGPTVLSLCGVPVPAFMHGRPFLGPAAQPEREYVFATRDRYDTSYDMIRASRDRRYKYLRHYYPREPYLLWVPYRNRHPITQELFDRYRRGELAGDELTLFRPRPVEELYDTANDPYELHNIADDPTHRSTLDRHRAAVDAWRAAVGDLGEMGEAEMVRRWYPGGVRPTTATPICLPIAEGVYAIEAAEEIDLSGPAHLQLQCATQGASIAWRFTSDPPDRWRLYSRPIELPHGEWTIRAKAIRIGYLESETVSCTVRVR